MILVGQDIPAQEGLRVRLVDDQVQKGDGTITGVEDDAEIVTVTWDSGEEETGISSGRDGKFVLTIARAHSFTKFEPHAVRQPRSGVASVATLPRNAVAPGTRPPSGRLSGSHPVLAASPPPSTAAEDLNLGLLQPEAPGQQQQHASVLSMHSPTPQAPAAEQDTASDQMSSNGASSPASGSAPAQAPRAVADSAMYSSQPKASPSSNFASLQASKRGSKAEDGSRQDFFSERSQSEQQASRTSTGGELQRSGTPPRVPQESVGRGREGMNHFISVKQMKRPTDMGEANNLLASGVSAASHRQESPAPAAPAGGGGGGRTDQLHKQLLAQEVIKLRKELQELRVGHEIRQKAAVGNERLLQNLEDDMRRMARERDEAIVKANGQKGLLAKEVRTLREELFEANSVLEYNVQQQQMITYDPNSPVARALAQRREFEENFTRNLRELREALSQTSLKELSASTASPVGIRTLLQMSDKKINAVVEAARGVQVEERLHIECLRIAIENCKLRKALNEYTEGLLQNVMVKEEIKPPAKAPVQSIQVENDGSFFGLFV